MSRGVRLGWWEILSSVLIFTSTHTPPIGETYQKTVEVTHIPHTTHHTPPIGETYQKTVEVESEEDWEGMLAGPILPPDISAPPGGFLLLASFQVLWSKDCQVRERECVCVCVRVCLCACV